MKIVHTLIARHVSLDPLRMAFSLLAAMPLLTAQAVDSRESLERRYQALCEDGRYRQAMPVASNLVQMMRERDASWPFTADDLLDTSSLATKLRQPRAPVSEFLRSQLSVRTQAALDAYRDPRADPRPLEPLLVEDLNRIIAGPTIYEAERFAGVTLRLPTRQLLGASPQGESLLRLNRLLVEDAYPAELSKKGRNTAAALRNLASVHLSLDELATAESLLREAIARFDQVLGPDSPDSSYSWDDLRGVYEKLEDYVEAEKCGVRALRIVETAYGLPSIPTRRRC